MVTTQLLCTFCARDNIDSVIEQIRNTYALAFDTVYILENLDDKDQLIITYNIQGKDFDLEQLGQIISSTISVHRKKQTNTIYTINALNKLILEKNNGILDIKYKIDWEELNNMVLVTAYQKLKKIRTKILEIRRLTD
jgi:hypothetical protein